MLNYPNSPVTCEQAPSAICMTEKEYRRMRVEGKILEIEKAIPCPDCPSADWRDNALYGASGMVVGLVLGFFIAR